MFLHRLHVYRTPARITAAVELCITSNISGVSVFQITLADIVVSLNEVCLSRSVVLSFFQQLVYEMFNTLFFKCSHMDMTIRKNRIYHQRLNGY